MVYFYTSIIESIHTFSIIWYAAATAMDKRRLQHIICSAERMIVVNLPCLQDLYESRTLRRSERIAADPSYYGQMLFETFPSDRKLVN